MFSLFDIDNLQDKYKGIDYSSAYLSDEDIKKIINNDKKLIYVNDKETYKNKNIIDGLVNFAYYDNIPDYNKNIYFKIVSNKLEKIKNQQIYDNLPSEEKLKIQKEKELKELEWKKIIKQRQEVDDKLQKAELAKNQLNFDKKKITSLTIEYNSAKKIMIYYIIILLSLVIISIVCAIKVNPMWSLLLILAVPIGYGIYTNKKFSDEKNEEINSYK